MVEKNGRGMRAALRSALVGAALFVAAPAHAAGDTPPRAGAATAASEDEIRRKLLLENEPWRGQTVALDIFPAVLGTLSLGASVVALVDDDGLQPTTRAILAGTGSVLGAAAFATYLAPKPLRAPLLLSETSLWFFGFALALSYEPTEAPETKQVLWVAAGASALEAAIPLVDALVAPPLDPWALASDRKALERADPTTLHGDVARAERNLARTTRPLRFVGPFVYLAGVSAMTVIGVRSGSDETADTALAFGLMFSAFASTQLLNAALPSAAERYERALGKVRLAPIGPRGSAGMTASWRF